jgi:hypothetical protein
VNGQPDLPDRLQAALEGLRYDAEDRELAALVAMAARVRELAPAGPDGLASARLRGAFEARMAAPVLPGWLRWIGSWAGSGPAPRPLLERLAAGVMLVGLAGGGAGAAAGNSPLEVATGTVQFVESLVTNLDPRDAGNSGATPNTTTPTPTPPPADTPTPAPGAAATATPTDDHGDDDDDDDSGDDNDDDGDGKDDKKKDDDKSHTTPEGDLSSGEEQR